MLIIEMSRGDLLPQSFVVRDASRVPVTYLFDEIYMTVKKGFNQTKMIFQKKLSDGSIVKEAEDGRYSFEIRPEDTDGLAFGDYAFDIELIKVPTIKKTFAGIIHITEEATHASNEVSGG